MNELVIKIDSTLLKEMIGGEVHIELRKGIVENFTRNHLKSLINDEDMEERLDIIEKEVMKTIDGVIKKAFLQKHPSLYTTNYILNSDFRNQISTLVRVEARNFAIDEVKKVKDYFDEKIKELKEHYDRQVPEAVNRIINEDFEKRVQDEINRRINSLKGDP